MNKPPAAGQGAEPFGVPGLSNGCGLSPHDVALVEAVARRVVDLLEGREAPSAPGRLMSAADLAAELGVARSFVYGHAGELGGVRLGDGPRARLRFDLEAARAAMACSTGSRSRPENASIGGRPVRQTPRRKARLPNRLPEPGRVLVVRGRSEGRS